MLYPRVIEMTRAGAPHHGVPRTQRDVVPPSLRLARPAQTAKPLVERDLPTAKTLR
jgi:hypothetical protein